MMITSLCVVGFPLSGIMLNFSGCNKNKENMIAIQYFVNHCIYDFEINIRKIQNSLTKAVLFKI